MSETDRQKKFVVGERTEVNVRGRTFERKLFFLCTLTHPPICTYVPLSVRSRVGRAATTIDRKQSKWEGGGEACTNQDGHPFPVRTAKSCSCLHVL